ncbi:hypothetical protein ACS49_03605 [Bacillus cereus]|nr:hypothetical protein ACS49_03605 [Bacillus cereus]
MAVNGSYSSAASLRDKVKDFCQNKLGLKLSESKTKITNTYKEHALFLGTNIKHSTRRDIIKRLNSSKVRSPGFLMLTAPMVKVAKKLAEAGFHSNHIGKTKAV